MLWRLKSISEDGYNVQDVASEQHIHHLPLPENRARPPRPPPDGAAPEEKWSHHGLPPSGTEQIDLKRAIEQVDNVDPEPLPKARTKNDP